MIRYFNIAFRILICAICTHHHTATDLTSGEAVSITYTPASTDYAWAYHVLEAYSLSQCTLYPSTGQVKFYDIVVDVSGMGIVSPEWTCLTKDTTCNEHATVASPSEVAINFDTSGM